MAEREIGFEVVRVRGNCSYTMGVYKKMEIAQTIQAVLELAECDSNDEVKCTFRVRPTRIY
jgi:hypothetical protein